jgi:Peptidase family M48
VGIKTVGLSSLWMCLLVGCSVSPSANSSWINRQGGISTDVAQQKRVEAITSRLTAGQTELRVGVHVLNSDAVCAYGLPNRNLFVTRGLLDRADDEVIAAALAHEFGHLLGDGRVRPVVSLRGCNEDLGAEGRADAYGVELLRLHRLPPESMLRMLRIVRDANALSSHCTAAMNQRIEWLDQQLKTEASSPNP